MGHSEIETLKELMEILSKLTPAETLLVLETSNTELKDLLKYTFMDLLLKKAIKTTEVRKQPNRRDRARIYSYVIAGENWSSYKPMLHEIIYLSPFQESNSIQILFRHVVKIGFQNSGGKKGFIRKKLMTSSNLLGHFKNGLFDSFFNNIKLTPKGEHTLKEIKKSIEKLEKELPDIINTDKKKALEILLTIKGNIFLLKNLDFQLLRKIDGQLMEEFKRQNGEDTGCYGGGDWGTHGDSFDSSFDSADSFGGDSGCSGCSGCGGCGGCG